MGNPEAEGIAAAKAKVQVAQDALNHLLSADGCAQLVEAIIAKYVALTPVRFAYNADVLPRSLLAL